MKNDAKKKSIQNTEFFKHNFGSYTAKYLVVGPTQSEKSKLIQRYANGSPSSYIPTVGVDFCLKNYYVTEDQNLKIQLWDVAGQERFGHMTSHYYAGACCAIIVVNMHKNLISDITSWLQHLSKELTSDNNNSHLIFAIIGNYEKEDEIKITDADLQKIAKDNKISLCFTVNVNNGDEINQAFSTINKAVIENFSLFPEPNGEKKVLDSKESKQEESDENNSHKWKCVIS